MKKILSLIFVIAILVGMLTIASTSTSAETKPSVHTNTMSVTAGEVIEYVFNLNINSNEKNLINIQVCTNYSDNLVPIFPYTNRLMENTSVMLPKLISGTVFNSINSSRSILYNYSSYTGAEFSTDDSTLASFKFLATKSGTATITTDVIEMCIGYPQEDFEVAVSESKINMPGNYSPNFSINETSINEVLIGDANNDGKVNLKDASAIQRHLASINLPVFNQTAANVDYSTNPVISIKDVTYIQQHVAMATSSSKHLTGKYTY